VQFIISDDGMSIPSNQRQKNLLNCGYCKYKPINDRSINNKYNNSLVVGTWTLETTDDDEDDDGVFYEFCIQSLCYHDDRDNIPKCNGTCVYNMRQFFYSCNQRWKCWTSFHGSDSKKKKIDTS